MLVPIRKINMEPENRWVVEENSLQKVDFQAPLVFWSVAPLTRSIPSKILLLHVTFRLWYLEV